MSALPPKADMVQRGRDVRFVPEADITLRSPDYLNCTWGERLRLAVLHLNSDAVDRLSGSVENPSEWLRRHVHDQTSLAVPFLNRLHDISVWRQFGTIWSKIVYRSLDLIEHKYRWPPMMMNRLFVVWLQGYLKHAKALVLEDDFVVLRSRRHRIQCWIPSRWIQIRTIIRHVTLAVQFNGLNSIAQLDLSDVRFTPETGHGSAQL